MGKRRRLDLRKTLFLLPNMITLSSIFCGFNSMRVSASATQEEDYYLAALLIVCSMFFDMLDGRVARLTKTQSAFGAEFDSLADMVSFGAAPALVMYEWVLRDLGKLGWVAAFIYCAGAALRLARFNTMLDVADKRWFTGIPSPAAAALVAGFVWVMDDYDIDPSSVRYWALFVTVFAGLTMVSNLKFYSFKAINLRKSVPFIAVLGAALVVALTALQPPLVFFGGFVAYALSGYVVSAWLRMRRQRPGASH